MSCWFHKYEELKEEVKYTFYDEICKRYRSTNYRICKKCHNVQEYSFDSQGGSWRNLTECENNIIKKYIDFKTYRLTLPKRLEASPPGIPRPSEQNPPPQNHRKEGITM